MGDETSVWRTRVGGESKLALLTTMAPYPGFTLLSMPMTTLLISDPYHMLMSLMSTFAVKWPRLEFVNIIFSGCPLPPGEWGSLHPQDIHRTSSSKGVQPSYRCMTLPSALSSRNMNLKSPLTLLAHI